MKMINDKELKEIYGGISFWTGAGIIGGLVFIIGVLDGFVNPSKCKS